MGYPVAGIGGHFDERGGRPVTFEAAGAAGVEVTLAVSAVGIHCSIAWPHGVFCLNCHRRFPCPTHEWAMAVLRHAGWTTDAISKLDLRTGPWS